MSHGISCPICGSPLNWVDTDSRQEWCQYFYYCEECENDVSRTVVFKTQSSMIASDDWDLSDDEMEYMRDEYEMQGQDSGSFGGDTGIDADYRF